jgi:hypothetical protein
MTRAHALSFVLLRWLGKSFSILAEASGKGRPISHRATPALHLRRNCRRRGFAPGDFAMAISIATVVAMLQYRHMINEQVILNRLSRNIVLMQRGRLSCFLRLAGIYAGFTALKTVTRDGLSVDIGHNGSERDSDSQLAGIGGTRDHHRGSWPRLDNSPRARVIGRHPYFPRRGLSK